MSEQASGKEEKRKFPPRSRNGRGSKQKSSTYQPSFLKEKQKILNVN